MVLVSGSIGVRRRRRFEDDDDADLMAILASNNCCIKGGFVLLLTRTNCANSEIFAEYFKVCWVSLADLEGVILCLTLSFCKNKNRAQRRL